MRLQILPWLLVLMPVACNYNEPKTDRGSNENPPPGQSPGFVEIREQVLEPYCAKCHGWTAKYQSVADISASIKIQVESGKMPVSGTLPSAQRDKLLAWIASGAPEIGSATSGHAKPLNTIPAISTCDISEVKPDSAEDHPDTDDDKCEASEGNSVISVGNSDKNTADAASTPNTAPQVITLNWEYVSLSIITPFCGGCHTTINDARGGIVLTEYADVVAMKDLILAAVSTDFMPMGDLPLPADLKANLRKWIELGTP